MKLLPFLPAAFLTFTLATATALDLQKGDHVCIVGNTFGERMQSSGYFEALLHARHGEMEVVVRNLSWSADTLTLKPRPLNCPTQDQYLAQHKASVVIACFGLNESFETPLASGIAVGHFESAGSFVGAGKGSAGSGFVRQCFQNGVKTWNGFLLWF